MTASTVDDFSADEGALQFWDPVADEPITETYLPAGTVGTGSSADVSMRIHNTSDGYTATGVVLATTAPADTTLSDASPQHYVSLDGLVFAQQVDVGDLAPHATSDPVWLRRVVPGDAAAGDAGFLLTATAASWAPAGALDPAGDADAFDPGAAQPLVDDPQEQM